MGLNIKPHSLRLYYIFHIGVFLFAWILWSICLLKMVNMILVQLSVLLRKYYNFGFSNFLQILFTTSNWAADLVLKQETEQLKTALEKEVLKIEVILCYLFFSLIFNFFQLSNRERVMSNWYNVLSVFH